MESSLPLQEPTHIDFTLYGLDSSPKTWSTRGMRDRAWSRRGNPRRLTNDQCGILDVTKLPEPSSYSNCLLCPLHLSPALLFLPGAAPSPSPAGCRVTT